MTQVHKLIVQHGREAARRMISEQEIPYFNIAASILEEESNEVGITYSGFCLTALPHRRLDDEQNWVRSNGNLSLLIKPGETKKVPNPRTADDYRKIGVPYGSKARLILLYLQTQAVRTNSPVVELGRSMNQWLDRMGVAVGGKTYTEVRNQAERISRCTLTFDWCDGQTEGFRNGSFVEGGIRLRGLDQQGDLWDDRVSLSEAFFRLLKEHPVPVWEPAIRHIAGKSMAFDIYVWLAYRLHVLEKAKPVSWKAVFDQFGTGATLRYFKPEFRTALAYALSVYPEAKVIEDEEGRGLVLHPSPPPIPERLIGR